MELRLIRARTLRGWAVKSSCPLPGTGPPAPTVRLYDTRGSLDKQGLILGGHAPLQPRRSRRRAFRSAPTPICVRRARAGHGSCGTSHLACASTAVPLEKIPHELQQLLEQHEVYPCVGTLVKLA